MYYLIIIAICIGILGMLRAKRSIREKKKSEEIDAKWQELKEKHEKMEAKFLAQDNEYRRLENIRENLLEKQKISKLRVSRQTF